MNYSDIDEPDFSYANLNNYEIESVKKYQQLIKEILMKDFLKKDLSIGDKVIFVKPGYREYSIGTILRFTNNYVIVSCEDKWKNEIKQSPDQLILYQLKEDNGVFKND